MIKAVNLSKIFNKGTQYEVTAVKDVDLKVEDGTVVAIQGPSGCGKTTILSMMGLILTPTSGSILIEGEDITTYSDQWKAIYRRKNVGFIFQHINLLLGYTSMENVLTPLLCHDKPTSFYREKALTLFKELKILERKNSPVEQLSGGEQQRVAFIRALISDPSIIFADEPTVFVDEGTSTIIQNMLLSLKDKGKSILLSTHDPNLTRIADKIYSLKEGTIITD